MKRRGIVVVAVLLVAYGLFSLGYVIGENNGGEQLKKAAVASGSQAKPDLYELWTLTNENRAKNNLPALRLDEGLSRSATKRCEDMVKRNYWSHVDPDGNYSWNLIAKDYGTYNNAGENLTIAIAGSNDIMSAWMGSKTHRDNILKTGYADVRFGTCYESGIATYKAGYIVVQHFASR